jgi:adenylosuccinate synthase
MPATIVMGGQWGDEGKGKLTDALAARAGMVVRANGGANAGHTVETDQGVFKLHLVPSGILNPDCVCVVGAGVVIDPKALLREMDELRERGVDLANFRVSDRAHLVLPYHPVLDRLEEAQRADGEIGTTLRGIGPAYTDKAARHGIRVADLLDDGTLGRKLGREIGRKNQILSRIFGAPEIDPTAVAREFIEYGERLRPYVAPSEVIVQDALAAGREVVVECAQGAMLDIDYGAYPYVTSSSPTAAGACQGAGVAPTQVARVIGVFKAYSTRVGGGPMPTELFDETGELIRERGREYGTTTGRPRRTGWFDAVAGRAVARQNGVTEICLTLLDVFDPFDEIKICAGYRLGTDRIDHVPAREDLLAQVEPEYETVPGWNASTRAARDAADLPDAALGYIAAIERAVGAPVRLVGVGPNRDELVPLGGDRSLSAVGA